MPRGRLPARCSAQMARKSESTAICMILRDMGRRRSARLAPQNNKTGATHRFFFLRHHLILAVAVVLLASGLSAPAQPSNQTITLTDAEAAQLLIENSRLDDAKKILLHDLETKPEDSET